MTFQVVRCFEGLPATVYLTMIRFFARVSPRVLFEVAFRGELLGARVELATERFARVNPLVGGQPIHSGERLIAAVSFTGIRLFSGVYTPVDLETVRREKRLLASPVITLVVVFALVCFEVRLQVAHRRVGSSAAVVDALVLLGVDQEGQVGIGG
jgi:hypothetical protein